MAEEPVTKAVASVIEGIQAPNILVMGATGVGKSTLINAVFGSDLATVGAGLPVTQDFDVYSNGLVNIYDSAGYELGKEECFVDRILNFLAEKQQEGIDQQIHLVWYIINASSARVTIFEKKILDSTNQQEIPAIIVLSQCDRAREEEIQNVREALTSFKLNKVYDTLEIAAAPLLIRGQPICEPFGLEELVDKTIQLLPEIYTDAVRMAQIVNLKSKRELAWKFIAAAAAVTFGSAWIPIPGAITGASWGAQESLANSIASVYGFRYGRKFFPGIVQPEFKSFARGSVVGGSVGTLGLDILRTLVPGPGNIIAGGTAASFIVITGLAYASAFEAMAKAHINPNDSEEINNFLSNSFPQEVKKYTDIVIKTTKDLMNVRDKFLNQ
ncbi:MAG: GTPase family protein [Gloeotrichia echinulata GP01]